MKSAQAINKMTSQELLDLLKAYEQMKRSAQLLKVPAFETKTQKGLMNEDAYTNYIELCKEILRREDLILYDVQSKIFNALLA